jgi:plastocyanin
MVVFGLVNTRLPGTAGEVWISIQHETSPEIGRMAGWRSRPFAPAPCSPDHETKEVDMKKLTALLFVLAISVGVSAVGGCGQSQSPTSPKLANNGGGGGTQITISGLAFSGLTVAKGAVVTWKNNDGMTHTATSDNSSAFQFDTGDIAPGATSRSVTFTQSGTFAYHCVHHSSMHGSITVQ